MKTQELARDSLQKKTGSKHGNQMFVVLYDLILYVMMPIAFEMSYVKIFQSSMKAYQLNDVDAMSRLIVYFIIQWFLGVLVRKKYIKVTLKRITLSLLILVQLKEVFFEDVFFDMLLSIAMESGLTVLMFMKFAELVVLLKLVVVNLFLLESLLLLYSNSKACRKMFEGFAGKLIANMNCFMHRIYRFILRYSWDRLYY